MFMGFGFRTPSFWALRSLFDLEPNQLCFNVNERFKLKWKMKGNVPLYGKCVAPVDLWEFLTPEEFQKSRLTGHTWVHVSALVRASSWRRVLVLFPHYCSKDVQPPMITANLLVICCSAFVLWDVTPRVPFRCLSLRRSLVTRTLFRNPPLSHSCV